MFSLKMLVLDSGCCGDNHKYAEVSLKDGGVLRVVLYASDKGLYRVTRFGLSPFEEILMEPDVLDDLIKQDACDKQVYGM